MTNIKNILIENEALNQMNLDLEAENEKLKDELTYFKARNFSLVKHCQKLASRNQKLECKVADLEFSRNFLGVTMTDEEVAIEAAENGYKPYNGDDF